MKQYFFILCPLMGSSTFQEFLGGKGIFYVFMFPKNKPVDKALRESSKVGSHFSYIVWLEGSFYINSAVLHVCGLSYSPSCCRRVLNHL